MQMLYNLQRTIIHVKYYLLNFISLLTKLFCSEGAFPLQEMKEKKQEGF